MNGEKGFSCDVMWCMLSCFRVLLVTHMHWSHPICWSSVFNKYCTSHDVVWRLPSAHCTSHGTVCRLQEVLYVASQDMQVAACSSFLQTLQQKLVPVPTYTTTFLQTIITSLSNKDPGTIASDQYMPGVSISTNVTPPSASGVCSIGQLLHLVALDRLLHSVWLKLMDIYIWCLSLTWIVMYE